MKTFSLEMRVFCTVLLDDHVIDVVDDEWRAALYDLKTPEEIAQHIAYNLLVGNSLSHLDGWADQPDSNASLLVDDILFD